MADSILQSTSTSQVAPNEMEVHTPWKLKNEDKKYICNVHIYIYIVVFMNISYMYVSIYVLMYKCVYIYIYIYIQIAFLCSYVQLCKE